MGEKKISCLCFHFHCSFKVLENKLKETEIPGEKWSTQLKWHSDEKTAQWMKASNFHGAHRNPDKQMQIVSSEDGTLKLDVLVLSFTTKACKVWILRNANRTF